ncbi:hypothetical protein [Corynebacterium vitaeruminis]|uniref:hypothetical protein n=1 Tax=Corynebacterium vitaeruminis TaxID=38305 RepID=UPI0012DD5386|nr:hypothetical protein [Corynebacterium vitaeruminis]
MLDVHEEGMSHVTGILVGVQKRLGSPAQGDAGTLLGALIMAAPAISVKEEKL